MISNSTVFSSHPILILGSSVAAGYYAAEGQGWADLLSENISLNNREVESQSEERVKPLSNFLSKFLSYNKRIDSVCNAGIPGTTVDDILPLVEEVIKKYRPALTIVSLSLGNEGLSMLNLDPKSLNENAKNQAIIMQKNFIKKYHMIASLVTKFTLQYTYNINADLLFEEENEHFGSITIQVKAKEDTNQIENLPWPLCILGSVYPNQYYEKMHYEIIKETNEILSSSNFPLKLLFHNKNTNKNSLNEGVPFQQSYSIPIIDFLTPLDDGSGKWREGLWIDPAHPNSSGHRSMYRAVEDKLKEL